MQNCCVFCYRPWSRVNVISERCTPLLLKSTHRQCRLSFYYNIRLLSHLLKVILSKFNCHVFFSKFFFFIPNCVISLCIMDLLWFSNLILNNHFFLYILCKDSNSCNFVIFFLLWIWLTSSFIFLYNAYTILRFHSNTPCVVSILNDLLKPICGCIHLFVFATL